MKKELLATFAFLTIGAFQIAAADEPTTPAVNGSGSSSADAVGDRAGL
jgi:hypothetical protein